MPSYNTWQREKTTWNYIGRAHISKQCLIVYYGVPVMTINKSAVPSRYESRIPKFEEIRFSKDTILVQRH
jgi:hypothetical protein